MVGACVRGVPPSQPPCSAAVTGFLFFCDNGDVYSCDAGIWLLIDNLGGPSGGLGSSGALGNSGATGATGAYANQVSAAQQAWNPLVLGASARTNDVGPACAVNYVGEVSLRGHLTLLLSPVPNTGGQMLAALPRRPDGSCACPVPAATPVVATTTALTFPTAETQVGTATVCIVRLLVSRNVAADVNLDGVVNFADETAVSTDPRFGSSCNSTCGRADVNSDGRVDAEDELTVRRSALYPTDVGCGAVYASSFSCGAYRRAPPQPAVGISLDEVKYRVSEGLQNKRGVHEEDEEVLLEASTVAEALRWRAARGEREAVLASGRGGVALEEWRAVARAQQLLDALARRGMLLTDVAVALATLLVCALLLARARK